MFPDPVVSASPAKPPIIVFCTLVEISLPAWCPIAILYVSVAPLGSWSSKANSPIAIALLPSMFVPKAVLPKAILLAPIVLASKAPDPTATLLLPVVFAVPAA